MEIRALTPELAADYFDFFSNRAFADNPYWKSCYCIFFHLPEKLPDEKRQPRLTRKAQAEALIRDGVLRGFLAYDNAGKVIGWCNANRKTSFARLASTTGDDSVLSVVCFVIDPAHRRQGIARALLARVIEEAPRLGCRTIEAYPAPRAKSASGHYHGPLALYESLGFQVCPGKKLIVSKTVDPR